MTWTCTASSGSSCSASGSGNIDDAISLEAGDSAFYTLQGTVSGSATGTLSNTASVGASGVNDPVPGNNSATDVDTIEQAVAPSINVQPANVTVTQPNSATFSVTASGTAPLWYQWRRNGVAISGAISWCEHAESDLGCRRQRRAVFGRRVEHRRNVTSASATLTVNVDAEHHDAARFDHRHCAEPGHLHRRRGRHGPAELSMAPQWREHRRRNERDVCPESDRRHRQRRRVQRRRDQRRGIGDQHERHADGGRAPQHHHAACERHRDYSGAASFSVVATGTAPLSYQWRRNGTNISGATNASYVLNPTALSDNGAQFSVVVTNSRDR